MKTNVYIDGFNLFYGCLRNSPFRWLDLSAFCQQLLPNDQIAEIKYFTARVSSRAGDLDKPRRQQAYLRALETIPNLTIIEGHYLRNKTRMALVNPPPATVEVWKTEEKGSDVNLAAHLLHDGHRGAYELAVVISNDSDLAEPIRLVIQDLKLPVGVINPQIDRLHPSVQLQKIATFFKYVNKRHLGASQFPAIMTDARGQFSKPNTW